MIFYLKFKNMNNTTKTILSFLILISFGAIGLFFYQKTLSKIVVVLSAIIGAFICYKKGNFGSLLIPIIATALIALTYEN